jgi:hypothetical protein
MVKKGFNKRLSLRAQRSNRTRRVPERLVWLARSDAIASLRSQ